MNFIIICGAPASGKMTVGQELQKLTQFKLFYNHMSLELVNQFFDFGTPHFEELDKNIRFSIFEEIAKSDIDGLIFTMVWRFNEPEDEEYIDEILSIFKERDPKVCFVELNCDLEERLTRNKHENRLKHKPSKRDIEFSNKLLLHADAHQRMVSEKQDVPSKAMFKIDNTNLSALQTAELIIKHFNL